MSTILFNNAAEVRAFLKQHGITDKVSVRWQHNPFGGEDKFVVRLVVPKGVGIIYSGGSQQESTYGSSDRGETAKTIHRVMEVLKGTNSFVTM